MTPERVALKVAARQFAEREIIPHLAVWEENGALPRSLSEATAAAGVLAVGYPEQVGGDGGDLLDVLALQEGFMEAGSSGDCRMNRVRKRG